MHKLFMLLTVNTVTMPFDQVHPAHTIYKHKPIWYLFCFRQFIVLEWDLLKLDVSYMQYSDHFLPMICVGGINFTQ